MPTRRRKAPRQTVPQSPHASYGPLRSYEITGLFGRPVFAFDLDKYEPTLLTGVNGTGKSTILRTIDAVSANQWYSLVTIPFDRIVLNFESNFVVVERKSDDSSLNVIVSGQKPWIFKPPESYRLRRGRGISAELYESVLAEYRKERAYEIHVGSNDTSAAHALELLSWMERRDQAIPQWISSISDWFPVLFVTDQRLIVDSPTTTDAGHKLTEKTPTRVAVEEAAQHIWREIQRHKSLYASVAQELDSDFPLRVVAAMSAGPPPRQPLMQDLDKLSRLRRSLEATGLLAAEDTTTSFAELSLDDSSVRAVVDTYVRDTRAKLQTLEPLRQRLQLFTSFLNHHYSAKRVVIDQDRGFRIEVDDAGNALPPARLSSGEQQILVLAHRILFRTQPGTLVLIDEPELSLHVTWQATFIDDLARMGRVDDLSFLLATHSPTLIGGREDLKRSLDLR